MHFYSERSYVRRTSRHTFFFLFCLSVSAKSHTTPRTINTTATAQLNSNNNNNNLSSLQELQSVSFAMGKKSKDPRKIVRRSSGRSNGSSSPATLSPPSTSNGNSPPIGFGGGLSDNNANLLQVAQAAMSSPHAHARARDPMKAMSPRLQELKKRVDERAAKALEEKLSGQNASASPFSASDESRPPPYGSTANGTPASEARL